MLTIVNDLSGEKEAVRIKVKEYQLQDAKEERTGLKKKLYKHDQRVIEFGFDVNNFEIRAIRAELVNEINRVQRKIDALKKELYGKY